MEKEEIIRQFYSMSSQKDCADLLGMPLYKLIHIAFEINDEEKYRTFSIPKKNGSSRLIISPNGKLKALQKQLNKILHCVYEPPAPARGFVIGRSIVDNAFIHRKKRWVLNLDLQDFFPSIKFYRVRGLFTSKPYLLPKEVAVLLAKICCYKGTLPQGAPTSPTISNMICRRLDSRLRLLAKKSRASYTRYADDITFSTTLRHFPSNIAVVENGVYPNWGRNWN